jgi:hypothetical protein
MKLIYKWYRWVLIVNLVLFCVEMLHFVVENPPEPLGHFWRLCGAVLLVSWIVLLMISVTLLFGNWRAGLRGLLVLFAEIVIGELYPNL